MLLAITDLLDGAPPSIVDLRLFFLDALVSVVLTTERVIVDVLAHKFYAPSNNLEILKLSMFISLTVPCRYRFNCERCDMSTQQLYYNLILRNFISLSFVRSTDQ